ncbi:MAG TPA: hypothetical protein VMH86_02510 [Rhizomicrobium sp.]|nr:hypothetical protein [Rhizomicrobium sp.]
MTTKFLRAAAAAILIGGAGIAAVAVVMAPVAAEAAGVRPAVGNPLKEAIALAGAGKGSEALAKVHEAESVPGLTAGEHQLISQTKDYIAAKTGQGGGTAACKARFANDYNAGRYRDVISDADCLQKSGNLTSQDHQVIAQAYYMLADYAACIREARAVGAQELMLSCAYKSGDQATMREVLEGLISTGHNQYWAQYLQSAENAHGLNDRQTLDIYRLRFLTGNMRNAGDYELAAELALQVGSAQEAVNVVQKGFDAKVLSDNRAQRLLALAKATAAKDQAGFAAAQKAADAAKNGEANVKLGEEYWGFGKYDDAISQIQEGLQKGVADKDGAMVRLGVAQMSAGKKDAAQSTFAKVSRDGGSWAFVAHLWSLYARTH